jgi:hypothetical protein
MNTEVDDTVFATVQRLNDVRSRQPPPLVIYPTVGQRAPTKDHGPSPAPERAHKPRRQPQPRSWDWRSKQP